MVYHIWAICPELGSAILRGENGWFLVSARSSWNIEGPLDMEDAVRWAFTCGARGDGTPFDSLDLAVREVKEICSLRSSAGAPLPEEILQRLSLVVGLVIRIAAQRYGVGPDDKQMDIAFSAYFSNMFCALWRYIETEGQSAEEAYRLSIQAFRLFYEKGDRLSDSGLPYNLKLWSLARFVILEKMSGSEVSDEGVGSEQRSSVLTSGKWRLAKISTFPTETLECLGYWAREGYTLGMVGELRQIPVKEVRRMLQETAKVLGTSVEQLKNGEVEQECLKQLRKRYANER